MYEYFQLKRAQVSFTQEADRSSSLHSNRDYEVGIVYLDEYARASSVLVSEYNTAYIPQKKLYIKKQNTSFNK